MVFASSHSRHVEREQCHHMLATRVGLVPQDKAHAVVLARHSCSIIRTDPPATRTSQELQAHPQARSQLEHRRRVVDGNRRLPRKLERERVVAQPQFAALGAVVHGSIEFEAQVREREGEEIDPRNERIISEVSERGLCLLR